MNDFSCTTCFAIKTNIVCYETNRFKTSILKSCNRCFMYTWCHTKMADPQRRLSSNGGVNSWNGSDVSKHCNSIYSFTLFCQVKYTTPPRSSNSSTSSLPGLHGVHHVSCTLQHTHTHTHHTTPLLIQQLLHPLHYDTLFLIMAVQSTCSGKLKEALC